MIPNRAKILAAVYWLSSVLRRFLLCLLVFLGSLPLPLCLLLGVFLLLFGRFLSFARVLADAAVFWLGNSRNRPRGTENNQQEESGNAFHGFSEKVSVILHRSSVHQNAI
jgi:hypothetical protein